MRSARRPRRGCTHDPRKRGEGDAQQRVSPSHADLYGEIQMSKQKSAKESKLDHPLLAGHADAIRSLGKRVVDDVTEIGQRLKECKSLAGHGNWLPWLDRE